MYNQRLGKKEEEKKKNPGKCMNTEMQGNTRKLC